MTHIRFSMSIGSDKDGTPFSAVWYETSDDKYQSSNRISTLFGEASWPDAGNPAFRIIKDVGRWGSFRFMGRRRVTTGTSSDVSHI